MTGLLSAGAALVSILSFVATRGDGPETAAAAGLAAAEVGRVELSPAVDSAFSLGDSLRFTSFAADLHGQAIRAAVVHWSVDNPAIATVDSTGLVVARAPGQTNLTVALGGRVARAAVVVEPRAATLVIDGDSTLRIGEGFPALLHATARDARGNEVAVTGLRWGVSDVLIATIDSTGRLRALTPGTAAVSVAAAGLAAERLVEVLPVPASITLLAGGDQRAPVGQAPADSIAVQVVSRSGRPVPGVTVNFLPARGAGEAVPDTVRTDAKGVAMVEWILGDVPGRQQMAVRVDGVDSALVLRAEADPLPANTRIELVGEPPAGGVEQALPNLVALRVTDSLGVALAGVPVTWTALDDGFLSQAGARTDSLGEASVHWQLGSKAGAQRLRVHVGNPRSMPPFLVTATAAPGPAVEVELVTGNSQGGTPGARLPKAVVFRAVDSLGNPVAGVTLRLSASSGVVDSVVETGEAGTATLRWTLGTKAGPAQLVAALAHPRDSAVASATVRPGTAATLAYLSPPASASAGKTLSKPVQVVVRDAHGNPVPGVEVSFTVVSGKVSTTKERTDAAGRADTRWTLGAMAGKQVLTARVKSPALKATHTIEAKGATGTKPGTYRKRPS